MLQSTDLPRVAVADEGSLRAALAAQSGTIALRGDIRVTESLSVDCATVLDGRQHTIGRAAGFTGPLLLVRTGGTLTLQCLTLDGNRARCAPGEPLISILGGTVNLDCGAILQNNHTLGGGGAVRLRTGPGQPGIFRMLADSEIVNCHSEAEGGGICAVFADPLARGLVRLAGSCCLRNNQAMAGGALAVRHLSGGRGLALVEGCARLTDNVAAGNGGGIFYAGEEADGTAAMALRLGGSACITGNRALGGSGGGGGVYFRGGAPGDRLLLGERVRVVGNEAQTGGGVHLDSVRGGTLLQLTGGQLLQNRAALGGGVCYTAHGGGLPGGVTLADTCVAGNEGGEICVVNAAPEGLAALELRTPGSCLTAYVSGGGQLRLALPCNESWYGSASLSENH